MDQGTRKRNEEQNGLGQSDRGSRLKLSEANQGPADTSIDGEKDSPMIRASPRPGVSRESSSTNVNSLFMRKLDTTPKASRGGLSFQSQQRSPHVMNESGAGARTFVINSGDVDKKRLVDQFYNAINESAAASSTDVTKRGVNGSNGTNGAASGINGMGISTEGISHGVNGSGSTGTAAPVGPVGPVGVDSPMASKVQTPTAENLEDRDDFDSPNIIRDGLTDETFNEIVRNGGFGYSTRNKLVTDEGLTNYLLNIDTLTEDITKRDFSGRPSLEALNQITKRVADGVHQAHLEHLQRAKEGGVDGPSESLAQLNSLSAYLVQLHEKAQLLTDELTKGRHELATEYKADINGSVSRLNELLEELNLLERRLTDIKSRIQLNKTIMSEEMLEKLEVLEMVDNRFREYSRVTRNRRFKQLNISLTVVVLLVSMYLVFLWN